jgi:hypothetical protein
LQKELVNTERNCRRILETQIKDRSESEKKLNQRILQNIDQLNMDILKEGQ